MKTRKIQNIGNVYMQALAYIHELINNSLQYKYKLYANENYAQ